VSRFTIPRDIFYGKGSLAELAGFRGFSRAFIVTDAMMEKLGFAARLEGILRSAGMEVMTFSDVENDPSIETVMEGARRMIGFGPDLIAAIGGGSCIDAAKGMWALYEHPGLTLEDMRTRGVPPLRHKARLAAIPSTSGTGSEVTAFTVISDHKAKVKYPIADFEITPDIAVLDEEITLTMPPSLVAYTGMDALCHAIEAYVALNRSSFTNPLAIHAITVIFGYLKDSYDGALSARGEIHVVQCLAGMAFTNAGLGITHSLAHKIGGALGLPHGLCNAILMPYVIKYNARERAAMRHYANIARRIGLDGTREMNLVNSLVAGVEDLGRYMQIPKCLQDTGISQFKFDMHKEYIASQAFEDGCTATNPRRTSPEDLLAILECAFHGRPVIL